MVGLATVAVAGTDVDAIAVGAVDDGATTVTEETASVAEGALTGGGAAEGVGAGLHPTAQTTSTAAVIHVR
ncbi:MAG: hypothetical protein M1570_17800 [Chloroflexi bacterium]|nr:hypothetical protein [Chloroflexota bacterium]